MAKSFLRSVRETKADFRIQDTNPIGRMFGGTLQSEVKCSKCGYRSRTYDHFQDLSIEVAQSAALLRSRCRVGLILCHLAGLGIIR